MKGVENIQENLLIDNGIQERGEDKKVNYITTKGREILERNAEPVIWITKLQTLKTLILEFQSMGKSEVSLLNGENQN